MTTPARTTSLFTPLTLRGDITHEANHEHWTTTHAAKVTKLPNLVEYVQRQFSATDHGFWPAGPGVGTVIPVDWQLDGAAELRFSGLAGILGASRHTREVLHDEQNVFARVVGYATAPGGGRWWTTGHDPTVGQHVVLLIRRRQGVQNARFSTFVRGHLPAALQAAGARDVRAYTFLPVTKVVNNSPGVAHDNPPQHRFHGAIVFGVDDRSAVDTLLASDPIAALVTTQHTVVTAVHAYAVNRSVPVVSEHRCSH